MRKDGCCGVQLGKIMNEVDRGWRRPSLKRNGSQQRDGDIDPSVTFSFFFLKLPSLPYKYKLSQMCTRHTKGPTSLYTQNKQHTLCFGTNTHTFFFFLC